MFAAQAVDHRASHSPLRVGRQRVEHPAVARAHDYRPEILRGGQGHVPPLHDDRRRGSPGLAKELRKRLGVRELVGGADVLQRGVFAPHGVPEVGLARRQHDLAPHRHRELAARGEPRPGAAHGARHVVEEEQPEHRHHGGERGGRHVERRHVRDAKFGLHEPSSGGSGPRLGNQRGRQVDSEHVTRGAHPFGRRQRRRAGAATQIEHPRARSQRQPLHGALPEVMPERQSVEGVGRRRVGGDDAVEVGHGAVTMIADGRRSRGAQPRLYGKLRREPAPSGRRRVHADSQSHRGAVR